MALPTPTPTGTVIIPNYGFEDGDLTSWDVTNNFVGSGFVGVNTASPHDGSYIFAIDSSGGTGIVTVFNQVQPDCLPGQEITARMWLRRSDAGGSNGRLLLRWFDDDDNIISTSESRVYNTPEQWIDAQITATSPNGTASVRAGFVGTIDESDGDIRFDTLSWDYSIPFEAVVTSPTGNYTEDDELPLRITITGTTSVQSVEYFLMTHDGTDYEDPTSIAIVGSAPWAANGDPIAEGQYAVYAEVTLTNGTVLITNSVLFTVGPGTPPPTREYNASNAYTYLVGSNFAALGSAIPSTALVTGVEIVVDYDMTVLTRSKDIGLGPELANTDVAFDCVTGGVVEAALMSEDGSEYTVLGTEATEDIAIEREDFAITEEAITGDHRWIVMGANDPATVTLGEETFLFGMQPIAASEFINHSLGIRFYPSVGIKPAYASSGDACFRFFINSIKLRVYFDAGSVEYYFASPDKTQVIKGFLVSAEVLDGDFRTGDAEGILQLTPDLEVMDGTQTWIGNDWTIHSAYPPTDANQIGLVGDIEGEAEVGMEYNGLPTQQQVRDNRSRYEFITENFYGDKDLDSIYGVHGLPRAFAYNADFFYKIYTQQDPEKDKPRHIANHHYHLALGFEEGRVDMSVVGQPYNFDGSLGASSTGIGDRIVGLLPLSGTILGVFCTKSIWGISGTTVDNFATQVISPNMGAIEYTICDMGAPTYANSYGVYTLAQTQQYGDYLGSPMSQDISPWLRPRLLRKYTSDKEVVCAWPVRSKNQYRLAFSDGYITSMTLNGSATPTFSFQKYFYQPNPVDPYVSDDLFSYPALVPAAISSQLDDSGEERIHVAPYVDLVPFIVTPAP